MGRAPADAVATSLPGDWLTGLPILTFSPASTQELEAICRAWITAGRALLESAEVEELTDDQVLNRFDRAQSILFAVKQYAAALFNSHPDPEMRAIAGRAEAESDEVIGASTLSPTIHSRLGSVNAERTDPETQHWMRQVRLRSELSGAALEPTQRAEVLATMDQVKTLERELAESHLDHPSIKVPASLLEDLPESFLESHPTATDGTVQISARNPDYSVFMSHGRDADARRALWLAFNNRGDSERVDRLIEKRDELAGDLGTSESWADHNAKLGMLKSHAAVETLLTEMREIALPRIQFEYDRLLAIKQRKLDSAATRVDPWDVELLKTLARAERPGLAPSELAPYLSYEGVRQGLFELYSTLFGVEFQRLEGARAHHRDVEVYAVIDRGGDLAGYLHFDPFPREGKNAHLGIHFGFPAVEGRAATSVILTNISKDRGFESIDNVQPFAHEVMHALNNLLSKTKRGSTSGIRGERDGVEAVAMAFHWLLRSPDVIQLILRDQATGVPIRRETAEEIASELTSWRGLFAMQELFTASLCSAVHGPPSTRIDRHQLALDLARATPFGEAWTRGTDPLAALPHFANPWYASGYYAYSWAWANSLAFEERFAQEGTLNPQTGWDFREALLEDGGASPLAVQFKRFVGQPFSLDPFRRAMQPA